jgi:hypothetical protein
VKLITTVAVATIPKSFGASIRARITEIIGLIEREMTSIKADHLIERIAF